MITKEQADDKKKKLAEARATIIENRITVAQEELKDLVQAKVDGKLAEYSKTMPFLSHGKPRKIRFKNQKKEQPHNLFLQQGLIIWLLMEKLQAPILDIGVPILRMGKYLQHQIV